MIRHKHLSASDRTQGAGSTLSGRRSTSALELVRSVALAPLFKSVTTSGADRTPNS